MSAFEPTGQKTAGTIDAQPDNCNCEETGRAQTPRGRPYCAACGRILGGERPETGERFKLLSYSALGGAR